jgi:hypothetical protein
MRWWMGWPSGVSLRAAVLQHGSAMVAGSCITGMSREVREANQLKKKRGIGSDHWKRMAWQGWWLSSPILITGGGPGARAPSGRGHDVKEAGVLGRPEFGAERKGAMGWPWRHLYPQEREGGGPGCIYAEEGKERGVRAWMACGLVAVPGHAQERQGKGQRGLAGVPADRVGPAYQ